MLKPATHPRLLNDRFDYAVECAMPDQLFEVNKFSFPGLVVILWDLDQKLYIIILIIQIKKRTYNWQPSNNTPAAYTIAISDLSG